MALATSGGASGQLSGLSKGVQSLLSSVSVPWFIFDLQNLQLITSRTIPGDISDSKQIVLAETPIAGLNYNPVQSGGQGNRKISFTLPLVKKNNLVGNILMLAQFQQLRNQTGFMSLFSSLGQFTPSAKVLYYWGTGSLPQEYYVSKCDFVHKSSFVNAMGQTQFSEISMELILDEAAVLYKVEEIYRKVNAILGMVEAKIDLGKSFAKRGGGIAQ